MKTNWMECTFKDKYATKRKYSNHRVFNFGKFKDKAIDNVCYCNPSYIEWCIQNLKGFKLTKEERLYYYSGLSNKLERDPDNEELKIRVAKAELFYITGKYETINN